jgi:hypothetical protein
MSKQCIAGDLLLEGGYGGKNRHALGPIANENPLVLPSDPGRFFGGSFDFLNYIVWTQTTFAIELHQ